MIVGDNGEDFGWGGLHKFVSDNGGRKLSLFDNCGQNYTMTMDQAKACQATLNIPAHLKDAADADLDAWFRFVDTQGHTQDEDGTISMDDLMNVRESVNVGAYYWKWAIEVSEWF